MGGKQLGFVNYEQSTARIRTKRETFLAEMEHVLSWKVDIYLVETYYPKTSSKGGRPAYLLANMLRIHLMQQWYSRSDLARNERQSHRLPYYEAAW